MDSLERYSFSVEWYQKDASMAKKLILYYFPADNTIELFDVRLRKLLLRRCRIDKNLSENDFYLGAKLTIYGRQIVILDCADSQTQHVLQYKQQSVFVLIKPDGLKFIGKILSKFNENDLKLKQCKSLRLDQGTAEQFYHDHYTDSMFSTLVLHAISGPVVACEVMGKNAVESVKLLIGDADPATASRNQPNSLRALFGLDPIENLVECIFEPNRLKDCDNLFFGQKFATSACFNNSTLCVVLPHAVKTGKSGPIISDIVQQGFDIAALKMVQIERANSEEFYEVYKGVVPEYVAMNAQLASGPCLALEIVDGQNNKCDPLHSSFRLFCGPPDPDIAKQLRPHTLRAKYGQNRVQNAVHCTDLEEDAKLEVEYFFKILN